MKSCELICNRESGKGIKKKTLNEVINKLTEHGYKTKQRGK